MAEIAEIVPGVWHWSAIHPGIRQPVHSYYAREASTAIDPMVPEALVAELRRLGPPERVVLTNRHHYRESDRLVAEFGCQVVCPEPGLHEFEGSRDVQGYRYGEEVAPGVTAHEVGAICPDDAALHLRVGPGLLAFADGLIRWDGELSFVPDFLMGDDPGGVKRGLVDSLARLLELDFDCLLFAHGEPLVDGGRQRLRDFVRAPSTATF